MVGHGFTDLPLVFTDQIVADVIVRLPTCCPRPRPPLRDEVELGAHWTAALGLLLVVRGHDALVEQMFHRPALSEFVILLPLGL